MTSVDPLVARSRHAHTRRVVRGLLASACVVMGAVLMVRPFASLAVLVLAVGLALALDGVRKLVEERDGLRWAAAASTSRAQRPSSRGRA